MYWSVKRVLDDIIDIAYKNESDARRKFFKWFTIDLESKLNKSYLGVYHPVMREGKLCGGQIRVVALNESDTQIIITCIHELAHHIDSCKNGKSGHQAPFYEEYKTLLYAALNMRLFNPDEFQKRVTTDFNKVKKMLDEWVPEYINYKQDLITLKVNVPFELKDNVKARGYHWNGVEKVWEKEIPENEFESEKRCLEAIGVNDIRINNASSFSCDAIAYIKASKGSYAYKEDLKQNGFRFTNNAWYKKINAKDYDLELLSLSGLRGLVEFNMVSKIGG